MPCSIGTSSMRATCSHSSTRALFCDRLGETGCVHALAYEVGACPAAQRPQQGGEGDEGDDGLPRRHTASPSGETGAQHSKQGDNGAGSKISSGRVKEGCQLLSLYMEAPFGPARDNSEVGSLHA